MDLWKRIANRSHPSLSSPWTLESSAEAWNGGEDKAEHMALGEAGEELATHFLRSEGLKVLYRNFRAPSGGEVDIVCRDGKALVFVEVKTRSSEDYGRPMDAVDEEKQQLVARGGIGWLRLLGFPEVLIRFDVVEIIAREGEIPKCNRIADAFQLPDGYYP